MVGVLVHLYVPENVVSTPPARRETLGRTRSAIDRRRTAREGRRLRGDMRSAHPIGQRNGSRLCTAVEVDSEGCPRPSLESTLSPSLDRISLARSLCRCEPNRLTEPHSSGLWHVLCQNCGRTPTNSEDGARRVRAVHTVVHGTFALAVHPSCCTRSGSPCARNGRFGRTHRRPRHTGRLRRRCRGKT